METINTQQIHCENSSKDIRIAYICLCHIDPGFVAHTAETLRYKEDGFFIHVDKKVDASPFMNETKHLDNVYFVSDDQRIKNYWGGFNSITATVRTIKLAMTIGKFDRFVILQGQDYPLFSNHEIHQFFIENRSIEFCHAQEPTGKNIMCAGGFWLRDYNRKNLLIRSFAHALSLVNSFKIPYRKNYFKNGDERWKIYKGWAQLSLTYECIQYLLDFYDNNPQYNKYMKYSFPPDELYFHTIIFNSKFRNKVSEKIIINRNKEETLLNLTYFEYPVTVVVFTEESDYAWLKETGCLYARKINSKSKELIDRIDSVIRV